MGRRKIEIKAIKDERNRSVTFLKRKGGLFKKAHELSVLCSVDVAVIIFGHNKKLYEFSSGDIQETLERYQYYGGAHEHKGPEDFNGRKDGGDDDDDDDGEDPSNFKPESHSPPEHAMIPQLHNQPPYQHIRHATPSASPPMPNGMMFHPQRMASPQPPNISRPASRTHSRRPSSHLAPPTAQMISSQNQPPQNSYAYMPNPPIYNPQAAAGVQGRPGQPGPPVTLAPPGPPGQGHPQQYPFVHPLSIPQVQAYHDEQRRQSNASLPAQPTVSAPTPPPQQQQHQPTPQPENTTFTASPPIPQPKPLSLNAQSHSIFTPIDDSRSLLAQWGPSTTDSSSFKLENTGSRSQSLDTGAVNRELANGRPSPRPKLDTSNTQRMASASVPIINPPSRTNSMPNDPKRPKLTVHIPNEHSDDEGEGSSTKADMNATLTPIRGEGHAGVVLPPPSPSASALLSAGASGPPNPFARPAPPSNSFNNRGDNQETPISALPSRFVSDQLLPSPSSFYHDWGFNRVDTNMLPSPLTFPTPIGNGPPFQDENEKKRKTSEGSDAGIGKRIKT